MNMHEEMPKRSARKILKGGLIILLVISIAFASGLVYLKERIDMLWYPRKFQSEVEDASARFGIEPNLIYAIIKAESDFTETAERLHRDNPSAPLRTVRDRDIKGTASRDRDSVPTRIRALSR